MLSGPGARQVREGDKEVVGLAVVGLVYRQMTSRSLIPRACQPVSYSVLSGIMLFMITYPVFLRFNKCFVGWVEVGVLSD